MKGATAIIRGEAFFFFFYWKPYFFKVAAGKKCIGEINKTFPSPCHFHLREEALVKSTRLSLGLSVLPESWGGKGDNERKEVGGQAKGLVAQCLSVINIFLFSMSFCHQPCHDRIGPEFSLGVA